MELVESELQNPSSDEGYEEEDKFVVTNVKMEPKNDYMAPKDVDVLPTDVGVETVWYEIHDLQDEFGELGNITESLSQLRNLSHINTKKISEMQLQFDDARVRIDKLLRRGYSSNRDFDYEPRRPSLLPTSSFDLADRKRNRFSRNEINSNSSTDSMERVMHKTEVKVKPKKLLREVSISIKCEQDQPIRIIDVS